jgi:hypothetical protein
MNGRHGATRRLSFRERGGDPATFDLGPSRDGDRAVEGHALELGGALTPDEDAEARARAVLVGWDGLEDSDGSPLPFSPSRVNEVLLALPAFIGLRLRAAILGEPSDAMADLRAFEDERRAERRLVEEATDATGTVCVDLSGASSDSRPDGRPDSFRALGRLCATVQRAERAAYMRSRARAPRAPQAQRVSLRTTVRATDGTVASSAAGTLPSAEAGDPPPPDGPRCSGTARATDRVALLDLLALARSVVAGLDSHLARRTALGFLWIEDIAAILGGGLAAARRAVQGGRFGPYSRIGKRIVLRVESVREAVVAREVRVETPRPAPPEPPPAWAAAVLAARARGRRRS